MKDPGSLESTRSIIVDIHPSRARLVLEALKHYKYEFGWSGNPLGAPDTAIEYHPLADIRFESNTFAIIIYPYRGGSELRVTLSERKLSGTWADSDGRGEFDLIFDSAFGRAEGWWNYGGQRQKYNAFMRRIE